MIYIIKNFINNYYIKDYIIYVKYKNGLVKTYPYSIKKEKEILCILKKQCNELINEKHLINLKRRILIKCLIPFILINILSVIFPVSLIFTGSILLINSFIITFNYVYYKKLNNINKIIIFLNHENSFKKYNKSNIPSINLNSIKNFSYKELKSIKNTYTENNLIYVKKNKY